MPNVIGGIMALIALSASVLKGIDPLGCLLRGAIAFFAGRMLVKIWQSITLFYSDKPLQTEDLSNHTKDKSLFN